MKRLPIWLTVFGLLSFMPPPSSAAILWYGGEDTSVTTVGSANVLGANSACYRSAFARVCGEVQNSTTVADPPANRITSPTFSATGGSVWVHARFLTGTVSNTNTNNEQVLILRSPDGVSRVIIRQTGTAATLKISVANAARSFTDEVTASAYTPSGTGNQLDLQTIYTCSGAGGFNLYIDAVLVATFSGNPCTDSATTLNQVEFAAVSNAASAACNSSAGLFGACWSELIVASEDTRSFALATCVLQAAGNTQLWTPSTLANVNKATISDTSFVSTPTSNQLSQWTCPTAAPTGTWGVKSFSIEARNLASITGPQNFDWSLRVSNADYLAGTTTALTNAFANYRDQFDTSPATSTTWGITEIYNTSTNQLGIGLKSLP